MQIEVYDPSIFVDFEFAKDKPALLSGAPPQCLLTVDLPHQPTPAEQLRLSESPSVRGTSQAASRRRDQDLVRS
jgi:ABC-type uncharacterized transport system substrate-binding protein